MSLHSSKPEFPPLLPIGRHNFSLKDLRAAFVDAFPLSKTRDGVMRGLESVVDTLVTATVCGELWIDGSFLTQKIDADDSDVTLVCRGEFYDAATIEQRTAMDWVNGNLYASHKCDSYLHLEYDKTSPNYWLGEYMHAYWMKQWGFSRAGIMKGIAVLQLQVGP